jgi:SAM-dependent methyltransferase
VVELVSSVEANPVRLLDVGSGPLSAFAGEVPGRVLEVEAVDPLADWYGRLYERHDVRPLVRPRPGRIEDLTAVVPSGRFHVVAARNALDHCADPVRGVRQMLAVVRPDGCLYLEHAVREGATRRYRGLHHWDLFAEDGRLRIGHREGDRDLIESAGGAELVAISTDEWGWVRAVVRPR